MELQETPERWEQVFAMIRYMLAGDFSHQISRSSHDDELENLIVQLNSLSQKLEIVFNSVSFLNPRKSYRFLTRLTFSLNRAFKIVNIGEKVLQLFGWPAKELIDKDFHELLQPCSKEKWNTLQESLPDSEYSQVNLELSFQSKDKLNVPTECTVTKMAIEQQASYSITFYKASILEEDLDKFKPEPWLESVNKETESSENDLSPPMSPKDHKFVLELRDEIMNKLKDPKPDLLESAIEYGIGETRLRAIFRHVFKYTPVQYHRRERALEIFDLVAGTDTPFSSISITYKFRGYAYFSNSFKERFGMYPKAMRISMIRYRK